MTCLSPGTCARSSASPAARAGDRSLVNVFKPVHRYLCDCEVEYTGR